MPQLDLILPAYNPSKGWHLYALERIGELRTLRPQWDIRLLVVSDGSLLGHEGEVQEALKLGMNAAFVHLHYSGNRGKGYALRYAVDRSSADYVLYTDWDFPFTLESYLEALDSLSYGAEVVLPVRQLERYMRHLSPMRRMLSSGSRLLNRLLLALPSNDTQGGIKAFNRRGKDIFLSTRIERFLFDTEFIALAVRQQADVRLTTCQIRPEIVMSTMSWTTLRRELRYIPRLYIARWFS